MSKKSTETGGIGLLGILTVAFIVLKLTNYIDWSWWWVLSPLWIPFAFAGAVGLIALVIAGIFGR